MFFEKVIIYEEQEKQTEQKEQIEQEEQIKQEEQIEQNEQTEQNEQRIIQTNKGGRPKSIIWGTYITQEKQISKGYYNVICNFCKKYWHKESLEESENNSKKPSKKKKLNKKQLQIKVSDFIESTRLTDERIKDINHALVKAFVVCRMSQKIIENPFFIEFLKTLHSAYTPSKKILSNRLLAQKTVIINQKIITEIKSQENLTLYTPIC
ncbi:hypothetical protein Glove_318g7 [Diversispora epigaea]|uniref:BED-type domain-containing protein n=1 Tax=Diversispora epigaea TaxID=1348612 RepID=A0A397HQT7_9GLOM|nr:hypothetical protein Glove_318g7 [Diversispora epigaea]